MRKNVKRKISILLASCSLFVMGLGVALWQSNNRAIEVYASTISDFAIDETASIRKEDPVGIRFTVTLGSDAQAICSDLTDVVCGTIMLPEDMLTGELTFDTKNILDVPTTIWKEENSIFRSVLGGPVAQSGKPMDIPESYYNRPIVARGYIKGNRVVDGETESFIYYTENSATRSIGYVATMAQLAGESSELLTTIAGKTTVEFPDSITLTAIGSSPMLYNTAEKDYGYGLLIGGIQADVSGAQFSANVGGVSYVSADETVVGVENGKLVAKKVGSTTVSASVTLYGTTYSGSINVTVNDEADFSSRYMIVVPDGTMSNHYAEPIKYAATELKRLFKEATGATIDILEETGNETTNGKYIALGNTKLGASVTVSNAKETASVVKTVGNTIVIKGVTDEGTMYGTYEWIASLLGYEYYAKDTYSLTKDAASLIQSTTAEWDTSFAPDIEYSISPSEDISTNDNLLNRYKMNNWYSDIMLVGGGRIHNVFDVLPPYETESASTAGNVTNHEKWYSHEWKLASFGYALDGVKDEYGRTVPYELCYQAGGDANEYNAMVSAAVEAYKAALVLPENAGLTKASLSIRDDEVWCQCSACGNSSLTPTDMALGFVNDVCAGIREWLTAQNDPRKDTFRMIFLAYHKTGAAPTSETTLDPYIDVWFAESNAVYTVPMNEATDSQTKTTYANLQNWVNVLNGTQNCTGGVRNNNLLVWTYNSNMYELLAPYDSFNSMRANYGLFKNLGVDSVYNYTDSAMSGWAALKKYLTSQLAWNATPNDATWDAWIDSFFVNAYGAGSEQMKAWFESYLAYEDTIASKFNVERSIYQDVANGSFFTEAILNTWLGYAEAALEALDKNDTNYQTYYNNIALERLSPVYLMLEIYGVDLDETTKIGYVATFCGDAKSLGVQKTGITTAIDEALNEYDALLQVQKDVAIGVGETLASNLIFDGGETISSVQVNGVEAYNNGQISLGATGAYKAIVTGSNGTMKIVMLHYADKVIKTVADLAAVKYTVTGGQNETGSISGYYVLGNDIDAEGATVSGAGYGWSQNTGFKGVFDGRNYTISNLTVNGNGIFGTLGAATVQNVNFENVTLGRNSALFASMSYNSTVKDVSVTYAGINADNTSYSGLLVARQSNNQNYWENVVLDAGKLTVPVALGYNTNNNSYENVTVKAANVAVIGYSDGGNTAIEEWPTGITFEQVKLAEKVTVSNEILAEIGGSVNGNALTVEKTKFAHASLTAGEAITMTVNGAAVSATAYDGYVLADLNGIGVTAGTVTTATILTEDYTIIYDNVFAVTMIIDTFSELSVVKYTGDKSTTGANAYAINGYYVLGGNIDGNGATFSGAVAAWNAGIGFCGTLDGRNYTISNFNTGDYGLFGNASNATVKNLKLSVNTAAANVLTGNYRGGTIENVEITVSAMSSTWGGILAGDLSAVQSSNVLVKDVTISTGEVETNGTHILCNTYPGATFENVQITTHRANAEKITSSGTPDGVTVTLVGKTDVAVDAEVLADMSGAKFEHSAFTAGETVKATVNGAAVTATAYNGYVMVGDLSGAGMNVGNGGYTAVFTTESYRITYGNVFYVTQIIDSFAELSVLQPKSTTDVIKGYYVLSGNINGNGATLAAPARAFTNTEGFCGTLDGRGYTVSNFATSNYGIFGNVASGAVIKDITFDVNNSASNVIANAIRWATMNDVTIKVAAVAYTTWYSVATEINNSKVSNLTVIYDESIILSDGAYALCKSCGGTNTFSNIAITTNIQNVDLITSVGTPAGVTVTTIGELPIEKVQETVTVALGADNETGLIVDNSNIKSGDAITVTANGATATATATADGTVTVDVSGLGFTAGTVYSVILDSKYYTLTCEDVMFADKVIREFSELSLLSNTVNARNTGYYILGGDIHGQWGTIQGGYTTGWSQNNGFGGTFDGRGYTIDRFSVSGYGIFGCLGQGVVRNVNFDTVTLNSGAALFARTMYNSTIENVTLKLNAYNSTSGECGIFVSRQTNLNSIYRNVTVDANGKDIYNVLGREVNANTVVENFVINNAGTIILYGASDTSDTAIAKPDGMAVNYLLVKVEETVMTALGADNETGLIVDNANIKSGDSITVTANGATTTATATADGTVTIPVSGFGFTKGTVYTVVLDTSAYALTCTDVMFADKVIREFSELSLLSNTVNARNTGYYILGCDIHAKWGTIQGGYTTAWNQNSGFGGVFDGRGYTIDRFSVSGYGIFGGLGQGIVRNVNFDMVTLNAGAALFARTMYNSTIENVTVKLNDYKSTSGECGIFVMRETNTYSVYRNVTVDANGKNIYNVLGRAVNANTTVENFVINNAGTITLYGASDTADTAIAKPNGMTVN